jgi:hypothetical protein
MSKTAPDKIKLPRGSRANVPLPNVPPVTLADIYRDQKERFAKDAMDMSNEDISGPKAFFSVLKNICLMYELEILNRQEIEMIFWGTPEEDIDEMFEDVKNYQWSDEEDTLIEIEG